MDWVDGVGGAPEGRGMGGGEVAGPSSEGWREGRGEGRPGRRPLDDRLEQWVSRGRELVDGVSGTRPGTRPAGRGAGGRLDGLGRWVEGKLDWLLDDRDDWREPWETERPAIPSDPAPTIRPRAPLEAISRRGVLRSPSPTGRSPIGPASTGPASNGPASTAPAADAPSPASRDWPEEDVFTVSRWRRQEPAAPPPVDPLAPPAPPPAPGRALPRSTRRR
jgi:hypothetical protein